MLEETRDSERSGRVEPAAPSDSLTRGFLFADLRGYTAFVEARGATVAADLLDRYRAFVRETVAHAHGAEIRTEGDSFYVVFPSVSRAVESGLAIVAAADAATAAHPGEPIRVGVGVHAGETVDRPDGYVGSAVNLAARLCALAQPGEVLVTDTVRALTANAGNLTFVHAGRRRLKGISEPVTVYRAAQSGAFSATAPVRRRLRRSLASAMVAAGAVAAVLVAAWVVLFSGAGSVPAITPHPSGSPSAPVALPAVPSSRPVALAAGRYVLSKFRPHLEFTVGSGWYADGESTDIFSLARRSGAGTEPDAYVSGVRIQLVYELPCPVEDNSTRIIDPTASALVDWLEHRPYLTVTEPTPVNVAGYTGLGVEVEQARPPGADCPVPNDSFEAERVYLYPTAGESFFLGPKEKVKLLAIETGGPPLSLVFGTPDESRYRAFIPEADRIVASMTIAAD